MAGMAELQQIIRGVEQQSLDEPGLDAGELARRACLSRFHFDRLASAGAPGEPPEEFPLPAAAGTGSTPAGYPPR